MTRITFILESLCELNNPRAINAYHFIDQLAKTHSEVKIITSYDERVEFSFNSKNILIYRPLNGLKFFESLNLYPLLINGDIDVLHVFAPFTKSKWNYMRNLKFAASFLKIVRNCKTSFSGYDPSFHNWSIKAIQKFNENFDLIFSHFHDQLPQSLSQPLIVPIIKDADPTIESNKNISIIANFSQILDEPELLKTLEDFLSKNKDWKVQICGGWGN